MHKILVYSVMCVLAFGGGAASAQNLNLGKPISPSDFTAWDIDVEPDARACRREAGRPIRVLRSLPNSVPPAMAKAGRVRKQRRAVLPRRRLSSAT